MATLYDYSDGYIQDKRIITIPNTVTATFPNNRDKQIIFKNLIPFINCISGIKNTEVGDAYDIDIVCIIMYNYAYL